MQYFRHGITHTLGARLMAMQAQLLADRTRETPDEWDTAFEKLLHGPEAQLLSSIWSRGQQREFMQYMQQVRNAIQPQILTVSPQPEDAATQPAHGAS